MEPATTMESTTVTATAVAATAAGQDRNTRQDGREERAGG